MKVILLKDVENIGKKFEVKEVKNGYARNFLLPNDLAKPATKEALNQLEIQRALEEKKSELDLKAIQETASKVDGLEVIIPVKLGEKGELYEKINSQKVLEKLREMGFEVKKAQIDMENPVQEIGEFKIRIKFAHNLESEINLIITEETNA